MQAGGCSFRAELTADYGDYVVPFALDCETEVNGQTHFTVAAPETLAGITAAVDETGGTVTYDGLMMDFGLLANGRLAPAAGPGRRGILLVLRLSRRGRGGGRPVPRDL